MEGEVCVKLKQHAALPVPTRDQEARQDYVRDLRRSIAGLRERIAPFYERAVLPAFERHNGRQPQSRHEIRRAMEADQRYQLWSLAQRISQTMGWRSVIDTVETQGVPDLPDRPRLGSLTLNPDMPMPNYHTGHDIHLMPGGYHGGETPHPLAAGAVFDLGVNIWGTGQMGPENELFGSISTSYFRGRWPDFKPTRILDMGCATGSPTLQWKRMFPQAEVYAIDVAGPCVAYGHRRAEALGQAVHFSQQNAEGTSFPDGNFDVVVSHIMLHETSRPAIPRIMRECHRLLRPGGIALHFDSCPASDTDFFGDFMFEWEVLNNNEPFLGTLREMDVVAIMREAGFPAGTCEMAWTPTPNADGRSTEGYFAPFSVPVYVAVKD